MGARLWGDMGGDAVLPSPAAVRVRAPEGTAVPGVAGSDARPAFGVVAPGRGGARLPLPRAAQARGRAAQAIVLDRRPTEGCAARANEE